MKSFLVLGGFIGCFIAFSSSLMAGNEIGYALRNGAIGCLAGAVLMKGFYSALLSSVQAMSVEKARQAHERAAANFQQTQAKTNGTK